MQSAQMISELGDVALKLERLVSREGSKREAGNADVFNEKNFKRLVKLVDRVQVVAKAAKRQQVTSSIKLAVPETQHKFLAPEPDTNKHATSRREHGLATVRALRSPRDLRNMAEAAHERVGHELQWKSFSMSLAMIVLLAIPCMAMLMDGEGVSASPMERLTLDQFRHFVTFNYAAVCIVVGIGLEIIIGQHLITWISSEHYSQIHTFWLVAQLMFPVFIWVAFASRSMFALPLLILGTFKFGLPEITGYIFSALYSPELTQLQRMANLLDGLCTFAHHCAVIISICSIITGIMILDRPTQSAVLGMLALHMIPMLRYVSERGYIVLALLLEAWTEWEILAGLQHSGTINTIMARIFLGSHWGYLIAGGLVLLNDFMYNKQKKDLGGHNTVRFWKRTFTQTSDLSMFDAGEMSSPPSDGVVKWGGPDQNRRSSLRDSQKVPITVLNGSM